MSKKKRSQKGKPLTLLPKQDEHDFEERLGSLEQDFDYNQIRTQFTIVDASWRNRLQLGSIQVMLGVISVFLSLHFFGWITAIVTGVVLGFVVIVTMLLAMALAIK